MIRLKDTAYPNSAAFLENAVRVAEYYGFAPIESLPRLPRESQKRPILPLADVEREIAFARRDERALPAGARRCLACASREGAVLAWRVVTGAGAVPSLSLELHIAGPSSAIAEALLIVVASAIAEEAGIAKRVLSVNNIGSPESSNRFVRDVGSYLRKHIESISPTLRPRIASDPLGVLVQLIEKGHPAAPRAPQAMEYLTEEERRRFWELLEYFETIGIPYELNPHILGSRDCWSHSLFEISSIDSESGVRVPIAFGGRYDPVASRLSRAPAAGTMISISCEARGKTVFRGSPRRGSVGAQPGIYFVHLGLEARRRSLAVLETLRRAGIGVHQGLWHERIGEQMAAAGRLATPYILIMGHKEAMEGTILVREVATNSQDAVPLPELTSYLRRRRVGILQEGAA